LLIVLSGRENPTVFQLHARLGRRPIATYRNGLIEQKKLSKAGLRGAAKNIILVLKPAGTFVP